MKNPFGMLIEDCDVVAVPAHGLLLSGPSTGMPVDKYATIRGAFSGPRRVRINSVANWHRTSSLHHTGILIEESFGPPSTLGGAILYEEGILWRVFSAYVKCSSFSDAAVFRLVDGAARGLVHVSKDILDAFIIGGGLVEGQDLWATLREIECLNGQRVLIDEIEPLGQTWAVPPTLIYESQDETKIVVASCGPATTDYPVAILGSNGPLIGHIITQQASGLIHAGCGLRLSAPATLASTLWGERVSAPVGVYQ